MSGTETSASCTSDSEGSCGKASPPAQPLKNRVAERMTAGDDEIIDGSIPLQRYINIVREKDERIRKLEQENKRLKTVLSEKTTEFRARIDELVQELDRHAELVDRLQTQLADFEVTRTATKDIQKSLAGDSGFTSTTSNLNQPVLSDAEILLPKVPVDADEICAALSSFVEKNKQLSVSREPPAGYAGASDKKTKGGSSAKNVIIEQQPITEVVGMGKVDSSVFGSASGSNIWTSIDTTAKACELPDEVNPSNLLALLFDSTPTPRVEPVKKEKASGGDKPKPAHPPAPPKEQTEEEARIVDAMQKRIAQNVSRLGGRPLNTARIALECKRLMTAYNVGQRLFAKAVMNQVVKSQGSLSELLSKPRQWHKLTDKGREAFRRIFGWMSDDKAIELLCQLSPRRLQNVEKVDHPTAESLLETDESNPAPLPPPEYANECLVEVKVKPVKEPEQAAPKMLTSPAVPTVNAQLASPSRTSRWRHDDIPKEKIIELFEAEKESHLERAMSGRSLSPSPSSRYSTDSRRLHDQQRSMSPNSVCSNELLPCPVIGRWRVEPIMQDQLEKHPMLDTEDIVRQVKDYLGRHSVSQRQFGENVLGLSQGSVSDLLARPKTWNLLTHKGREPFIRMKLFLDECYRQKRRDGNDRSLSESSANEADLPTVDTSNSVRVLLVEVKSEPPSEMVEHQEEMPVDTAEVARRVKETISRQGISLKVLGENVLGITASEVCELLTRPKPWHDLPLQNRDPYRKLLEVITDEREIARLKELEERATAMRNAKDVRKIPVEEVPVPPVVLKRRAESGDDSSSDSPNKKCPRTIISDKQKEALLYVYSQEQRPSPKTIDQLALKLGLTSRTVTNWFHNHRTRQKAREAKLAGESVERPPTQCPCPASPAPSEGWFKDIHELLRANSVGDVRTTGSVPTMVPTSASNILKSISDQISSISEQQRIEQEQEQAQNSRKTSTSADSSQRSAASDGSQLDKAIARMHKLAAGRK